MINLARLAWTKFSHTMLVGAAAIPPSLTAAHVVSRMISPTTLITETSIGMEDNVSESTSMSGEEIYCVDSMTAEENVMESNSMASSENNPRNETECLEENIERAARTIISAHNSNSDILSKFFNEDVPYINDEMAEKLTSGVHEILHLQQIKNGENTKNVRSSDCGEESWESLSDHYMCVFCRDVMTAPKLTNCEHSFCGPCIDALLERCAAIDDENVDVVVHQCPVCRDEVKFATYERTLDACIADKVSTLPPSERKEQWQTERLEYLKKMRLAKAKERAQKEANRMSDNEDDMWGDFDWAGLVFVVSMLIMGLLVWKKSHP